MKRCSAIMLMFSCICCAALTLFFSACRGFCSGKTYLAKDGKTAYTIVCEEHEPVVVATGQTASDELKLYLEQITGATFPVVKESSFDGSTPALYIGKTKYALKHELKFDVMAPEFWTYQTVGDAMIFAGGKNSGALLAVCEFLEHPSNFQIFV